MENPKAPNDERRCDLTGEAAPRVLLLRFVPDPQGRVVFDIRQDLPAEKECWLSPRKQVVEQAFREGVFSDSMGDVVCPPELAEQVERLLLRRLLDALSLLRRSGALISGFEKVRIGLAKPHAAALVQASDASPDGREKVARLAVHHGIPVIDGIFSRDMLAAVTGQENQAHLLAMRGGLADRLIAESQRFVEYMASEKPKRSDIWEKNSEK